MWVRFVQWTLDVRDVGRMAEFWSHAFVVLADPEGNEFCVLRREPRQRR